ncbi:hypothetical protein BHE74_00049808, partial [Ensete ventricosum]
NAGGVAAFYDHSTACDFYICTPAKLGSLRWHPGSSGDYDGMVTEYDVGRRVTVFERDEHAGRHVRSVDYSPDGELGVSGSDDGVAQLWDTRCGGRGCVGVARAGAAVRGSGAPNGTRTFAEVRGRAVASSGTDGSHRLWDWVGGGGGGEVEEVRAYRGHANALRFVGMSVWHTGGSRRERVRKQRGFSVRPPVGGTDMGAGLRGAREGSGGRVRQRRQLEAGSGDGGTGRGRAARRRIERGLTGLRLQEEDTA